MLALITWSFTAGERDLHFHRSVTMVCPPRPRFCLASDGIVASAHPVGVPPWVLGGLQRLMSLNWPHHHWRVGADTPNSVLPPANPNTGATGILSSESGGCLCCSKCRCPLVPYTHPILVPRLLAGLGRAVGRSWEIMCFRKIIAYRTAGSELTTLRAGAELWFGLPEAPAV